MEKWIKKNRDKLPKTLPKLQKTIDNFCLIRKKVLTSDFIIDFLKKYGYITVDNDETVYLIKNRVEFYGINDIRDDKINNVQKEVLLKSMEWLIKLDTVPTKLQGLINSIEQLCVYRFNVSSQEVINMLTDKNKINIEDGSLSYSIFNQS